jgi:hypothetical protein
MSYSQNRQGHCGPKGLMPRPTCKVLEQHGIDWLVQTIPSLFLGGIVSSGKMLGHIGFPLGQCRMAMREVQAHGETDRAHDREAPNRMMG